jgi:hypothetical protein
LLAEDCVRLERGFQLLAELLAGGGVREIAVPLLLLGTSSERLLIPFSGTLFIGFKAMIWTKIFL